MVFFRDTRPNALVIFPLFQTNSWLYQENIHPSKPTPALLAGVSVRAEKALQWAEGLTKHLKWRRFSSTKGNFLPSPQKIMTKHPNLNECLKKQLACKGAGGEAEAWEMLFQNREVATALIPVSRNSNLLLRNLMVRKGTLRYVSAEEAEHVWGITHPLMQKTEATPHPG